MPERRLRLQAMPSCRLPHAQLSFIRSGKPPNRGEGEPTCRKRSDVLTQSGPQTTAMRIKLDSECSDETVASSCPAGRAGKP